MGLGPAMQHPNRNAKRGLMRRLLQSQEGNIAMMSAAVILPVTLMVGSGVDFSRYYVVKSRMQLACDAGALAGRKVMGKSGFTSTAQAEANKFFDGNFIGGSYGSRDLVRSYTEVDGVVEGTATAKLDNSILRLANINEFEIRVECNTKLDIANTDIMFVLDTTGSMDVVDAGSTGTRMQGLRDAVKDFAAAMEGAKGSRTVVRYGFVPYASGAKVGHLLRKEWLTNSNSIQSREAIPDGSFTVTGSSDTGWVRISGTATVTNSTNLSSCSNTNATRTNNPTTTNTVTNGDGSTTTTIFESYRINGTENICTSYYNSFGSRRYNRTRTVYNNAVYNRTTITTQRPNYMWRYGPVNYNLTTLKGSNGDYASPGASMDAPVGNLSSGQPTMRSVSWSGCIEETPTQQITDWSNVPDLSDIDINHVPDSNDNTKWRMQIPALAFGRAATITPAGTHSFNYTGNLSTPVETTYNNYYNALDANMAECTNSARALEDMTPAAVGTYVDGLQARGSTYHDIGLVWGGRLISDKGIYGASNTAAASAGITRHVIFMSDGATSPMPFALTAYGIEPLDQRRTPFFDLWNRTPAETQINGRLQLICDQLKSQNITVWTIAFGTDVLNSATAKSNLENCATPGRYYEAANNAALRAKFVEIASQIAELRLTR